MRKSQVQLTTHIDIDECSKLTDNCDNNALCNNTIGGFTCSCKDGYWGDGVNCTGIIVVVTHLIQCLVWKEIFFYRQQ